MSEWLFKFKFIRKLFLNQKLEESKIMHDKILYGSSHYYQYSDGTKRHVPIKNLVRIG